MSDDQSFQRFTAMTAIMSFLFAVASIVLQGIPINFSLDIAIETVFSVIWNMVHGGMWNIRAVMLAGIWFLGIGLLLRGERRLFSIFSLILSISALLDSLGMILSLEALALPAVASYVLLAPIWALWLGIDLVRKPVQIA